MTSCFCVNPKVKDAPVTVFDEHGLGQEANNLAAINSLNGYRSLRWGRNVELIITDERSYRSEDPGSKFDDAAFFNKDYSQFVPVEVLEIIDGGRDYNGGKPPNTIRFGDQQVPNIRKADPAQTLLGAEQKAWFLERLRNSKTTWKIWGSTTSTLDMRADPQNLPSGMVASAWPGAGYASLAAGTSALPIRSVVKSTISFKSMRLRDLPRWRATGIASGLVYRRSLSRRNLLTP
jgi:alkaline phosphatase D